MRTVNGMDSSEQQRAILVLARWIARRIAARRLREIAKRQNPGEPKGT